MTKKTVDKREDKLVKKFKDVFDKAAGLNGSSKTDLLIRMGYSASNAKQIVSRADRTLPAYHVAEFCKAAGNNLLAEWIAEQLGMKLVPENHKENSSTDEVNQLKKELDEYKKLVAELYKDLKKS
jgi:hypothetical protein